jgi:hypothetical protein
MDSERGNLTALYQRYVAENTPPAPEMLTDEERPQGRGIKWITATRLRWRRPANTAKASME